MVDSLCREWCTHSCSHVQYIPMHVQTLDSVSRWTSIWMIARLSSHWWTKFQVMWLQSTSKGGEEHQTWMWIRCWLSWEDMIFNQVSLCRCQTTKVYDLLYVAVVLFVLCVLHYPYLPNHTKEYYVVGRVCNLNRVTARKGQCLVS